MVPITLNDNFPLINTNIACGSASASLEIDMETAVDLQGQFAFTLAGSLIPPQLKDVCTSSETVGLLFTVPLNLGGCSSMYVSSICYSGDANGFFSVPFQCCQEMRRQHLILLLKLRFNFYLALA